MLAVLIFTILVFEYSYGNADGDYWWYGQLKRVSDSKCGREIELTFEEHKTVYLRYDGAPLPDSCVVNISIYNPISRYSIICLVLHDAYVYSPDYDCRDNFRFYFGRYPKKTSSNYYSCSDIREPVCDYNYNSIGYASFNPWDKSENKTSIEVKLYTLSGFPKPPTTSRPTETTYSTWSSWSSWSSDDRGRAQSNISLVIILVVAGFVLLIVVCGVYCMRGKVNSTGSNRARPVGRYSEDQGNDSAHERGREGRPREYTEYTSGTTSNAGRDSTASRAEREVTHAGSDPNAEEYSRHLLPSAPPALAPEDPSTDAPPPSYSSLFGTG